MIDFDEFKKRMLEAKKGMVNEGGLDGQQEQAYTQNLIEDEYASY